MNEILQSSKLTSSQNQLLYELLKSLNTEQKAWLGGYITGLQESTKVLAEAFSKFEQSRPALLPTQHTDVHTVKIMYGTRSGNSLKVAKSVLETFQNGGLNAQLVNLNEYEPKSIKQESNVLIVLSTDGEGEPTAAAEEFYNFVMGKKAPRLENLKYSVLALGDSSYKHFCKIGKDIDSRLQELGAHRISDRIDCDVEFEPNSQKWTKACQEYFTKNLSSSSFKRISSSEIQFQSKTAYSKNNPFPSQLIDRINLNGKGSTKSTYHIEFSLEDSGLSYEPGDALGVVCANDSSFVDEIISQLKLNPEKLVNTGESDKSLRETLISDFEISSLNIQVLENYNKLLNNNKLTKLLKDKDETFKFIYGRDILDLVLEFPQKLDEQEFVTVLRKLQPRLYSIASSQKAFPDEVHLTVGAVSYQLNSRLRKGVCSNFLANLSDEQKANVYIDENISFRLPSDTNAPIIMIGAGTGIAPYRAFLQEIAETGSNGKNWLFFGERNFTTDFLYQVEWQKYLKNKTLSKLDVAFSRDQDKKVYVQHKLQENQKELYKWLEEGAHVYLCGDKNSMANDVKNTLIDIIQSQGGITHDKASEYFKKLRREARFHEDVY